MSEETIQEEAHDEAPAPSYTEPTIGGADYVITDVKQPKDQQAFLDLMAACPNSWQGDEGFKQWCEKVYGAGAASVTPPAPPAPVISAINPPDVVAGTTGFILYVSGTGFSEGAVVTVSDTDQGTTLGASATVDAAMIGSAGTVPVQVRNADGALSNSVDLTVS